MRRLWARAEDIQLDVCWWLIRAVWWTVISVAVLLIPVAEMLRVEEGWLIWFQRWQDRFDAMYRWHERWMEARNRLLREENAQLKEELRRLRINSDTTD